MRRRVRRGADAADVNMTPMLDIVFILLIFFIVTATFLQEKGVEIMQPRSDEENRSDIPTILVQINPQDEVFVNQTRTDVERVTANIQRQIVELGGKAAVQIAPSIGATHGVVTRVYDESWKASPAGVAVTKPE